MTIKVSVIFNRKELHSVDIRNQFVGIRFIEVYGQGTLNVFLGHTLKHSEASVQENSISGFAFRSCGYIKVMGSLVLQSKAWNMSGLTSVWLFFRSYLPTLLVGAADFAATVLVAASRELVGATGHIMTLPVPL